MLTVQPARWLPPRQNSFCKVSNLFPILVLMLSAAAAGAVNSLAGGGTLLTFPALLSVLGDSDEASVIANATSTLALWPGSIAGLWGYRREMAASARWGNLLIMPSLGGGLVGSLLVVVLPAAWFKALVPWLILTAALLFALQPRLARWFDVPSSDAPPPWTKSGVAIFAQFLIAVYGGYFGAGIGILMLSSLSLMGLSDIHRINAVKSLLASIINGTSVAVFLASGAIHWKFALLMSAASIVGGFCGAWGARRLDRQLVRNTVVVIGFTLAAWYFYQEFGRPG